MKLSGTPYWQFSTPPASCHNGDFVVKCCNPADNKCLTSGYGILQEAKL